MLSPDIPIFDTAALSPLQQVMWNRSLKNDLFDYERLRERLPGKPIKVIYEKMPEGEWEGAGAVAWENAPGPYGPLIQIAPYWQRQWNVAKGEDRRRNRYFFASCAIHERWHQIDYWLLTDEMRAALLDFYCTGHARHTWRPQYYDARPMEQFAEDGQAAYWKKPRPRSRYSHEKPLREVKAVFYDLIGPPIAREAA